MIGEMTLKNSKKQHLEISKCSLRVKTKEKGAYIVV